MYKIKCPCCNEKIQVEVSCIGALKTKKIRTVPYERFKQVVDEKNKLKKEIESLKK